MKWYKNISPAYFILKNKGGWAYNIFMKMKKIVASYTSYDEQKFSAMAYNIFYSSELLAQVPRINIEDIYNQKSGMMQYK